MIASQSRAQSGSTDARLNDLIDVLTARLQAGEPVEIEACVAEHPEYADRLRRLLPALQVLAELSHSREAQGAAPPDLGPAETGTLGDFRIIREVGRGGMGIVYEAAQISLNRRVALKVLPFAATMDPRQLQRFRNEAQAAACLHHPHIVPVHGVGCERAVHFYAMQLIDGQTLAQVIADSRSRLPGGTSAVPPGRRDLLETPPLAALTTKRDRTHFRHIAELIAHAADALEYAHSMGVVHRDIKPANLMLDNAGHLWITDFGLAKLNSADAAMTMTGDMIGTLRYMSPEQALAKHGLVDHRTDVYSLGATLYELLTLHPAVQGDDKQELLKRIAFEEPTPLRRIDKSIPAELETITLKALAKEPVERYVTAGELAEDLRRWLGDKTIKARRPTVRQRLARWARRHPGLTAAVGLAAGLLLAGAWAWEREKSQAETAARAVAAESDQLREADRLSEALAVARRAADLMPRVGGNPDLRRGIAERVADLQLLTSLEEARLECAAERADGKGFDVQQADPVFLRAFNVYGVDVLGAEEATVIQALQRRAIVGQVTAALAEWERIAPDPAVKGRLIRLVDSLDADHRQIVTRTRRAAQEKNVEALKRLAAELEADPLPPSVLIRLGRALTSVASFAEAERLLRVGQQRNPGDFWMNYQLAVTLAKMGPTRAAESVRFYSAALALRPHSPSVCTSLGVKLAKEGRSLEAEAAYRRAISLKPNHADAHNDLGVMLAHQSRFAEGVVHFNQAIALMRDDDMTLPQTYYNLGLALRQLGHYEESLTAYRRSHNLGSKQPPRFHALAQWVRDAERMVAVAPRLPALLMGETQPADAHEQITIAKMCQTHKKRYATAARFYAAAFAADPKLAEELDSSRYNAACSAAKAGCGQGEDAATLDDAERTRLRRQALEWLTAELAAWAKRAEKAGDRAKLRQTMHHWQKDTDIAGVRDTAALAKLPEAERADWQKLWADVADLLKRTGELKSAEKPPPKS